MKMLVKRACGRKRHSLEDFYKDCDKAGIKVIRSDEKFSFYFCIGNIPFIVLPKRLTGLPLLFAALHESAHALYHPGSTALFGGDSKDEEEADAIALVSMMPDCELLDDSDDAYTLWMCRMALKQKYGV